MFIGPGTHLRKETARIASLLAAVIASLGLVFSFAVPASASAAQIKTWRLDSRFVDPSADTFKFTPSFDPLAPLPPPDHSLRSLPVNVSLPSGYDSHHRYPVLYLLHGLFDNYRNWIDPDLGDLRQVARGFPGVIVMPEADRGGYGNWWNGGLRADPAWERYFFEELIPLVDRRLSIRHGRRWHAIAGFSVGGLGATFLASQRPGYFGSAASFSGILDAQDPVIRDVAALLGVDPEAALGDPVAQRFYWSGHNPVELARNLRWTRSYVTVGDGQPVFGEDPSPWGKTAEEIIARPMTEKFVAAARRHHVPVTYVPRHGTHDWPYFRQHLAAASKWGFFRPVRAHPRRWSYKTVAQRSAAFGFRFRFREPPSEVISFHRHGKELSGDGSGRVRITMHRKNASVTEDLPFTIRLP